MSSESHELKYKSYTSNFLLFQEKDFLHLSEISFRLTSLPAVMGSYDITEWLLTRNNRSYRREMKWEDRSTGVTFETKDFKVTAAYASGYTEVSGTSSDGTHEDDPGETLPPGGIGSSRKRPKKEKRQPPARKNMKTAEVEKETLMLENGKNQAEIAQEETTQSLIPTPVRIVMFAIFVFVIFVHVINRLIQVVCS
ncbi:unnamed protein product [Bubo scandiacus]